MLTYLRDAETVAERLADQRRLGRVTEHLLRAVEEGKLRWQEFPLMPATSI